jgi:hypothetical protein
MSNFTYTFRNKTASGWAALDLIFLALLVVLISPWIHFWLAYFCGWIAKLLIGKYIVEGFALFGIMLPLDKIPLLAGALGWVGSFFKTTVSKSNNN